MTSQPVQVGDYIIQKTIGQGTFGKVKLGYYIVGKEKVAIKILEKSKIKDKDDSERVDREINILQKLNHPNVILVTEIFEKDDKYYIVMEYCEGGELFNYIVKKKRLTEEVACYFFYQIIRGVEYIHSKGIAHRDLKPENLLMDANHEIKIIDFGLSNYFSGSLLSTPCGSPCYASPEMVSGKKYNGFKIDVWSCGIILYAMLCGYLPFEHKDNTVLYKKIMECKVDYPHHLSSRSKDMMRKILVNDLNKRIEISEIKKHPFYLKGKEIYQQELSYRTIPKQVTTNNEEQMIYQPIQTEGNFIDKGLKDKMKSEKVYTEPKVTKEEVHLEMRKKKERKKEKNSITTVSVIPKKEKKEYKTLSVPKKKEPEEHQNKLQTEYNITIKRKPSKPKKENVNVMKHKTNTTYLTNNFHKVDPILKKGKDSNKIKEISRIAISKLAKHVNNNNSSRYSFNKSQQKPKSSKPLPKRHSPSGQNSITIKNTVINVNMIDPSYLLTNYQIKSYLKPKSSGTKHVHSSIRTERKKLELKFYDMLSNNTESSLPSYGEAMIKTQENCSINKYSFRNQRGEKINSSHSIKSKHSTSQSKQSTSKSKHISNNVNDSKLSKNKNNLKAVIILKYNSNESFTKQNNNTRMHTLTNKIKQLSFQDFLSNFYRKKKQTNK